LVSGQLHRNGALAGLVYRPSQKLSMNLDYEGASSDNIYFRTSLNDYNRGRARAQYKLTNTLALQARIQVLNNQNPDPSIKYDLQSRDNALSIFWNPNGGKRISIMGEYDRSTFRSDIAYLGNYLTPGTSSYRENAHTATSAMTLPLPHYAAAKLVLGGSLVSANIGYYAHDPERKAWREGGKLYKNPFGLDPKIVNKTLEEASHCRRKRIAITTFMLAADPVLLDFVRKLTELNHGRIYETDPNNLGSYVFRDFVRNRRKRLH